LVGVPLPAGTQLVDGPWGPVDAPWELLCPDLQDLIVREVASSASLVRLRTLAPLCSAFEAAYSSRLTACQSDLLHAGSKLAAPDMRRALLAMLHRQMTRHPLVPLSGMLQEALVCHYCGYSPRNHVWSGNWPWVLMCPAHTLRPGSYPSWYEPVDASTPFVFLSVMFRWIRTVRMLQDGDLEDIDIYALWYFQVKFWWVGCTDGEDDYPAPGRLSHVMSMVRAVLGPPLMVEMSSAESPREFEGPFLTVTLRGYEALRRVVIKTKVVGRGALLGFVLALGQGAERMQQEPWLQLEVGLEDCKPDDVKLPDVIASMLPFCKQLILRAPDGVRWVCTGPMHAGDTGVYFKSLVLAGLDSEVFADLSELPLHQLPLTGTEWVSKQADRARVALTGWCLRMFGIGT
jgi:hypothetical protein